MSTIPPKKIDWATDVAAAIREPSAGKKGIVFEGGEQPPEGFLNWLFETITAWQTHTEDISKNLDFAHLQVTAQSSPDNTVAVADGRIAIADKTIDFAAGNSGTFADADATNDRIDLLYLDETATLQIVTGVPSGSPVVPVYESRMVLAEITIRDQATIGQVAAIVVTSDIRDVRPVVRESNSDITTKQPIKILVDGLIAKLGDEGTVTFAAITNPGSDSSEFLICLNGDASTFNAASSGGDDIETVRGLVGYPTGVYDTGQSVFLIRFVSLEIISRVQFLFANKNWVDGEDVNLTTLFRVGHELATPISGTDGVTNGSTTFTSAGDFAAAGVVPGDKLRIKDGVDVGVYVIANVVTTTLTLVGTPAGSETGLAFDVIDDPKVGVDFDIAGTKIQNSADPTTSKDLVTKTYNDNFSMSRAVARHSATQTISTGVGGGGTVVAFNSEDDDTDGYHDNSTNNSRLTAPVTGMYLVTGTVTFLTDATGVRTIRIRRDGSVVEASISVAAHATIGVSMTISAEIALGATGYVELLVEQSSGGDLDIGANPFFRITKIAQIG